MDILFGIVIGIVIGTLMAAGLIWVAIKRAEAALEKEVDSLVDAIKAEAAKTTIAARVEQHGDVFYIYDTANDHFLAQGSTVTELREILELRFRDKKVFVTEGEESTIDALRATGQQ